MQRYPDIGAHGLIGDLQTAALVSVDGTIDWLCLPRFDSPSVFASLLDHERGGHFRIAPESGDYVTRQLYVPGTAVLITRFMSADGVGEVIDFMPVAGDRAKRRHRLVRLVRVVRGSMRFLMEIHPRFDYGRKPHDIDLSEDGASFRCCGDSLTLHRVAVPGRSLQEDGTIFRRESDGARLIKTLTAGETVGAVLEWAGGPPKVVHPKRLDEMYAETTRFWGRWLGRSTYQGRWQETVTRSAMSLKLMTYAPSGAIIAAPTAGLPEIVGGERNWDYRYTWIRDASFSVYSLLGLGYVDEAAAFVDWLGDRVSEAAGSDSGPLKIMYRVDGTSSLDEEVLEHFEGYRGSRPVRIGNAAADQLQLDIYGEAMDSIHLADVRGLQATHQGWLEQTQMLSWLCDNWDRPEEGIWETRGGRQDFTYGRFMSWVALDRAIRLAEKHGRPADVQRWAKERDRVYEQVMSRGFDPASKAFVQHYGAGTLDASLLLMPLMGFVAPKDPMWLSTLDAISERLVSDSLVYRYDPGASPDGLRGREGTFSLCTFFYVDALARSGRLEEARLIFEKMSTYGNHLGLYSEEIGLTGEQLGNFPQAFSHLALINAAMNLDYQLDHGAGNVEPVLFGGIH